MKLQRGQVALGVLAGGQASRLGGADKALARHEGATLLARALAALGSGYAQYLLSYNRAPTDALPATMRVVPDLRPGSAGPLSGIEALLSACETDWLLTVPVDLAEFPADLFESLADAWSGEGARARDLDGLQPLVALWRVRTALAAVTASLEAGEGAVHRVQDRLCFESRDFPEWRVGNLNSPADLRP